jgi:hypothetical protein
VNFTSRGFFLAMVFPTLKLHTNFGKNKCFLSCWKVFCIKIIWHQRAQISHLSSRCKRRVPAVCNNTKARRENMWHDSNISLGNSAPCKTHHWTDWTEEFMHENTSTLCCLIYFQMYVHICIKSDKFENVYKCDTFDLSKFTRQRSDHYNFYHTVKFVTSSI